MAVTPSIKDIQPVVGGSADVWGGIINERLREAYADIVALASQGNDSAAAILNALLKSGGTMSGDIQLADVPASDVRSVGYRGSPIADFSEDKTLSGSDAGVTQRLTGTTSRTLTIPPGVFPVGTIIPVRASGSANMAIARGSGVSLTVVGSATNKNCQLSSRHIGTILQESPNVWVLSGSGVS